MKQDVTEYLIDSFVDFKGEEHKIVACALSQSPEESEDGCKLAVGWVNEMDEFVCVDDPDYAEVCRVVSVGISVCHPTDTFDKEREVKLMPTIKLCTTLNVLLSILEIEEQLVRPW